MQPVSTGRQQSSQSICLILFLIINWSLTWSFNIKFCSLSRLWPMKAKLFLFCFGYGIGLSQILPWIRASRYVSWYCLHWIVANQPDSWIAFLYILSVSRPRASAAVKAGCAGRWTLSLHSNFPERISRSKIVRSAVRTLLPSPVDWLDSVIPSGTVWFSNAR